MYISYAVDIDYVGTAGIFTISGTSLVIVPVNLINDTDVEISETFFGNIVAAAGQDFVNVDFDPILATAMILNDDSMCYKVCMQ